MSKPRYAYGVDILNPRCEHSEDFDAQIAEAARLLRRTIEDRFTKFHTLPLSVPKHVEWGKVEDLEGLANVRCLKYFNVSDGDVVVRLDVILEGEMRSEFNDAN